MILGRITGKTTTTQFQFIAENGTKKFEYVQIAHEDKWVLCQVVELERDSEKTLARCTILGFNDENGKLQHLRTPFEPGIEVLKAEDDLIKEIVQLGKEKKGALIGKLDGKDIDVYLDLHQLLTKHVAVLAKSGAGKSYTVGALIEEIISKRVPLLIIDPHGEYSTLKYPNDSESEIEALKRFNLKPESLIKRIQEFGDMELNPSVRPIKLTDKMDAQELMHILPTKLNANQIACLYSALKNLPEVNFESLLLELEMQDSPVKWTLIDMIQYLRALNIFSSSSTDVNELIQPGKCSIINLKGFDQEVSEIVTYKLLKNLFDARKKELIPPFFAVLEEAHNFCPERSFGEAKSSKIIRTIASEGRKFGLGLCVVSQRPARVDKSVLSQCSTQIILKVTNPHDLRAISSSVEGITAESDGAIQNLPVGTALVAGVVDMPLFVDIRPRKTKHGGMAVDMLSDDDDAEDTGESILDEIDDLTNKEVLPLIKPKVSLKDVELMSDKPIEDIETFLIPAVMLSCRTGHDEFNILVDLVQGKIIKDIEKDDYIQLPDVTALSGIQLQLLTTAVDIGDFTPGDIMMKLEIDFGRAQDMINQLSKKGFFNYQEGKYRIADDVALDPKEHAFFGKITYESMRYETILDKNLDAATIKSRLAPLVDVKDMKECNIVWHKIAYGINEDRGHDV